MKEGKERAMWEGYEWGEGRPDKILLSQVRTGTRGKAH